MKANYSSSIFLAGGTDTKVSHFQVVFFFKSNSINIVKVAIFFNSHKETVLS